MPDVTSLHQLLAKELNSLLLNQDDWPGEIATPADNDPAPEYRMNSKGKRLTLIRADQTNK